MSVKFSSHHSLRMSLLCHSPTAGRGKACVWVGVCVCVGQGRKCHTFVTIHSLPFLRHDTDQRKKGLKEV